TELRLIVPVKPGLKSIVLKGLALAAVMAARSESGPVSLRLRTWKALGTTRSSRHSSMGRRERGRVALAVEFLRQLALERVRNIASMSHSLAEVEWHALRYSEGRGELSSLAARPSEYLRACHPFLVNFSHHALADGLRHFPQGDVSRQVHHA